MTRWLFWEDMYLKDFNAVVASIDGTRVVLDQTAFNPRGGGLVSDTGLVGSCVVEEVEKNGQDISHALRQIPPFKVGETVGCTLDWERRYRIMKMHTAAHILSAVVNRAAGALITGNQISPDESRVDFSLDEFNRDKLGEYVDTVNRAIGRGLEVKTSFMKREEAMRVPGLVKLANAAPPSVEALRIVQIGDIDMQADGGVHVKNTLEIGRIAGTRAENKGKSNRRIYFTIA